MTTLPTHQPYRAALGALALAAALCSGGAAAQVVPGGTMPEALKGIGQASAVCRAQDPSGNARPAALLPADMGCAVPVNVARELLQRPDTVTLDVRPATDYESFHIGGALNANLSDLHSKPYWRGKVALLVGSGKAERELYMECTRLKKLGYKDVKVLHGGMPAWLASNQPVLGRAPAHRQLARLMASELWLESQNPDNLVILDKAQSALQKDIAFSRVVPQLIPGAIRSLLERRRVELKNAPLAALVVAADPSTPDQQIEQLRQALHPVPVLVYTEPRDAYVRQLAVQKAMWLAQARGPKQPACGQ